MTYIFPLLNFCVKGTVRYLNTLIFVLIVSSLFIFRVKIAVLFNFQI